MEKKILQRLYQQVIRPFYNNFINSPIIEIYRKNLWFIEMKIIFLYYVKINLYKNGEWRMEEG